MSFELVLTLIVIGAIFISVILIFLSGVIKVKNDEVAIIEKFHTFDKVLNSGWHFIMPIFSHRVKTYNIKPVSIKGRFNNFEIFINFKIEDYQKYYYSNEIFEVGISKRLKKISPTNREDVIQTIEDYARALGITILKIELSDI